MKNIGFELTRPDRNWPQKLWAAIKFCFFAAALAWWLLGCFMAAFFVYAFGTALVRGAQVNFGGQKMNAVWFFIGSVLMLYIFLKPLLESAFRR